MCNKRKQNYTISTMINCTEEEAKKLTDLISDFVDDGANNAVKYVDAATVLLDENAKEIY